MNSYPIPALLAGAALQKAGVKLACLVLLCGALSSCASQPQHTVAKANPQAQQPPLYDWHGDAVDWPRDRERRPQRAEGVHLPGRSACRVDLSGLWQVWARHSYRDVSPFWRRSQEKSSGTYGAIVNSSGQVIDSDAKAGRESIPPGGRFVGAPMPYWMRLTGTGIGMHAGRHPASGPSGLSRVHPPSSSHGREAV